MSQYTKQILFIATGIILVSLIGYWNPTAQQLLGLFAFGWMLSDIARTAFPAEKK